MSAASDADRIHPIEGWRALRALISNPDDTAQVFRVIRALSGRSFERLLERTRIHPTGARILAEERHLLPVLSDRSRLLALPEGTLGHTYAEFMEQEQISADGLAQASTEQVPEAASRLGPDGEILGERLRDMHDLWHVVSGYGRDLLGEASLLAFTYAQTRNRGIGAIVGYALWRLWRGGAKDAVDLVRGGYRRGKNAEFLPAQDWEALLELPLSQVRAQLRVEPAPDYEQQRSSGAPPVAAPA